MRPKSEPKQVERELFQSELEQIIDLDHALVRWGKRIDWVSFEAALGATYHPTRGAPGTATRLMVALHYLKYEHDLSDEAVVLHWLENPYWQHFSGERYFQHQLPIDASSMTRWRARLGAAGAEQMLRETIAAGIRMGAIRSRDLKRVNVDTTVQTKAVRYPTDARLYHRSRERLVKMARREGVAIKQSYRHVGERLLLGSSRCAHARQMKQVRSMIGDRVREAHVDMGYRGHDYSGDVVVHADKRTRGRTPKALWRWMKRRAAVEPSIGHLKNEHRLKRNRLRGTYGDAINAMLAAAAMNFHKLLGAFWLYFLRGLLAIRGQLQLILTPIGPQMSSRPI